MTTVEQTTGEPADLRDDDNANVCFMIWSLLFEEKYQLTKELFTILISSFSFCIEVILLSCPEEISRSAKTAVYDRFVYFRVESGRAHTDVTSATHQHYNIQKSNSSILVWVFYRSLAGFLFAKSFTWDFTTWLFNWNVHVQVFNYTSAEKPFQQVN